MDMQVPKPFSQACYDCQTFFFTLILPLYFELISIGLTGRISLYCPINSKFV